ncbi:MAG: 50S ribosomal protein L17 [Bacteroidota bacterium]
MRHGDKVNNLGRKSAHRKAMLANMASSLILHKRINTTLAKAKALRVYVEPILTKSKSDSTHSRRTVFAYLGNKEAVDMLFKDVATKIADRPGGYTRILKTGGRPGDNADMCFIELVDFNENMLSAKAPAKAKTSRRGGKKKSTEATAKTTAKKEDPTESTDEAPKSE